MGAAVEGPVRAVHGVGIADMGRADAVESGRVAPPRIGCGVHAQVVELLGPAQKFEERDGVGAPAGDVTRQLLEHRQGALAAPVGDRLGDVGPGVLPGLAERTERGRAVERDVADQVADVGMTHSAQVSTNRSSQSPAILSLTRSACSATTASNARSG